MQKLSRMLSRETKHFETFRLGANVNIKCWGTEDSYLGVKETSLMQG